MSNRIYGYVGVNSPSEENNSSLESQKKELILYGVKESKIIIEIGSVINEIKNRPKFQDLIKNILKEGDTLVVTKIDGCARNTLEFLKLQDSLFKRKIQFISLDLPYYEDSDINKLISLTLSSIAEFETNRRKERQMQGISAAKEAGRYRGRKTIIDDKLISEVKYLKQQRMLSVTQIVKITGKSRNTIYKVLKEHLGYVSNRLIEMENDSEKLRVDLPLKNVGSSQDRKRN